MPSFPSVSPATTTVLLLLLLSNCIAAAKASSWLGSPMPVSLPIVTVVSPETMIAHGGLNGLPNPSISEAIDARNIPASLLSPSIFVDSMNDLNPIFSHALQLFRKLLLCPQHKMYKLPYYQNFLLFPNLGP